MDAFDCVRAQHEGRILRLRNMQVPDSAAPPKRAWWDVLGKRRDADARYYHQCVIAGWWEVESEILFGKVYREDTAA